MHGRDPPSIDPKEIRMDWRHEAACRDEDPELFFPIGNTGPALSQIDEAKTVCRRCPVVEPCLQWALERKQNKTAGGQSHADGSSKASTATTNAKVQREFRRKSGG